MIEGLPEMPVLDHVRQWICANLAMVEVQHRSRGARAHRSIPDDDVENRLCMRMHMAPDRKDLKHPPRRGRERTDPSVKGLILQQGRIGAIDDDGFDARLGERDPEREANHAPTRNDHVAAFQFEVFHGAVL